MAKLFHVEIKLLSRWEGSWRGVIFGNYWPSIAPRCWGTKLQDSKQVQRALDPPSLGNIYISETSFVSVFDLGKMQYCLSLFGTFLIAILPNLDHAGCQGAGCAYDAFEFEIEAYDEKGAAEARKAKATWSSRETRTGYFENDKAQSIIPNYFRGINTWPKIQRCSRDRELRTHLELLCTHIVQYRTLKLDRNHVCNKHVL